MRIVTTLVASSALLLSCATADGQIAAPQGNCHNSCVVTVSLAAGCGSGIRVSLDPITVTRGNTTTITWNIVPASPTGWRFDANGIALIGLDSYARGKFKPESTGNPHSVRMTHENTGPAAFKYDVNLVKGSGSTLERCSLDPTIVDQ
jgi:hypothetical protein